MKLTTEVYQDKAKKWRWRVRHGKLTAASGESFASKTNARRALAAFLLAVKTWEPPGPEPIE